MDRSSCVSRPPLVTLGDGGPSVIDYSLPESTCFSLWGRVALRVDPKTFLPVAFEVPSDNFWARADRLSAVKPTRPRDLSEVIHQLGIRLPDGVLGTLKDASRRAAANQPAPKLKSRQGSAPSDDDAVVQQLLAGMYPVAERTLWGNYKVHWAPKPDVPKPRLFIIERYTTCSYLGNYGAGRTVETLSLLPGEQTTISIRTYEDFEETASRSENVVDSFSESSSAELENSLLEETSETTTDDVSSKLNQGGLTIGIPKIFEIKFEAEGDVGASSTRESYAHQIDSAVSRQLSSSSRSRDVSVNVTTSESARSGSEKSITRQLTNINRSRVLNFVFRQLLQEYLTITFLRDVRVVFTNGYPESERVMTIPELADRLPTLVRPEQVEPLLRQILGRYCEVMNHAGVRIPFIEEVNVPASTACGFATGLAAERYFRIRPDVTDSWRGVDVPGVILKARSHILRTRSVIVEALLGQGEALDCYNQSLQAAAVDKADADNARLKAAMLAADAITDPVARARAYVQLVNGCCEEPKSETQE